MKLSFLSMLVLMILSGCVVPQVSRSNFERDWVDLSSYAGQAAAFDVEATLPAGLVVTGNASVQYDSSVNLPLATPGKIESAYWVPFVYRWRWNSVDLNGRRGELPVQAVATDKPVYRVQAPAMAGYAFDALDIPVGRTLAQGKIEPLGTLSVWGCAGDTHREAWREDKVWVFVKGAQRLSDKESDGTILLKVRDPVRCHFFFTPKRQDLSAGA